MNSTTLLLPAWKLCLEELELAVRIMPRDVRTRWNSTYDMLSFSLQYRKAIEYITSDLKNNLRKYELTDEEWIIADELKDTLKVTCHLHSFVSHSHNHSDPFRPHPLPRSSVYHMLTTVLSPQILKDGTEYFSRGTPNLATVIPAMDHIDTTFTNAIRSDSDAHPAIRYSLRLAKKTLNKYYSLTDEAEVYRIAMSKCFEFIEYTSD